MPFIRSISGIRATLDDSLRPDVLTKYVAAYCNSIPKGPIVVGRDGRPSGKWIANLVVGTIAACGREVMDLGICPTPTVQLITEKTEASGGISITASHNPEMWNGLKFLNSEGVFLNQQENEKFWKIYEEDSIEYSTDPLNSSEVSNINSVEKHINAVLESGYFDIKSIKKYFANKKYKVVVDAVNASGSLFVPALLVKLGCEVVELFTDNTGVFPHTPEPITENLILLSEAVINHKADIGIAVDPDADRLVIIDENGLPIGEEKTIALSVKSVLSSLTKMKQNFSNTVVVNQSTSGMIEKIAAQYNTKVERSAVGEINVVELMKKTNAIIGGEGSGGVIMPHIHYGRDSLVGIALVLKLISESEKSVGEISENLPKVYMIKDKIELTESPQLILEKIKEANIQYEISNIDGIRIVYNENDWVHIRASNTEPIVRIIVESSSQQRAEELLKQHKSTIKKYC